MKTILIVIALLVSNQSISQQEEFVKTTSVTEEFTGFYPLTTHPVNFLKTGLDPSLKYKVSVLVVWNLNPLSPDEFALINLLSNGVQVTTNIKMFPRGYGEIITSEISWVVIPDSSGSIYLEAVFGKSPIGSAPLRVYSLLYTIKEVITI